MTYQELINEYLDGQLAGTDSERELFDGLAEHPEWREEMALQLRMEQAMQRDLSMVAVPPAATNAIFSRLHFTPSNALAQTSTTDQTAFRRGRKLLALLLLLSAAGYFGYTALRSNPQITTASRSGVNGTTTVVDSSSASMPVLREVATTSISKTSERATASAAKQSSSEAPRELTMQTKNVNGDNGKPFPTLNTRDHAIPNDPNFVYLNVGNFYSVAYVTRMKLIGVFEAGKIYYSEDGGHAWKLQWSGTTNDLFGVNFRDNDTMNGIVVGGHGTVLRTSDAGKHWVAMTSGIEANLIAVRCVTADTIYACGESGSIIRSIDGGSAWTRQTSGTSESFFRMQWKSGAEGEVRGAHDIRLTTRDAGATWMIVK